MKFFSLLFVLALSLASTSLQAQNRVLLYPTFQTGTILMKNKQKIKSSLNYDAKKHELLYQQGEDIMIVSNINQVDTVYINQSKFISNENRVMEYITLDKGGYCLIDWNLLVTNIGYVGAYGQTVQGGVKALKLSSVEGFSQGVDRVTSNGSGNDNKVYRQRSQNTYYIYRDDKMLKFKDKKSFLKLFTDRTEELSSYIKENDISFQKAEDVIKLINHL